MTTLTANQTTIIDDEAAPMIVEDSSARTRCATTLSSTCIRRATGSIRTTKANRGSERTTTRGEIPPFAAITVIETAAAERNGRTTLDYTFRIFRLLTFGVFTAPGD